MNDSEYPHEINLFLTSSWLYLHRYSQIGLFEVWRILEKKKMQYLYLHYDLSCILFLFFF
jgi:hypothetical protein